MMYPDLSRVANHLGQSTIFAAAVWALTLSLRQNRAAVRYWLWLAASVKFLVPFSLLVSIGSHLGWRESPVIGPVPISHVVERISQSFALPAEAVPAVTTAASSSPVPAVLFGIWLCGFAVSAAVWLRLWRRFRAALRAAAPLQLGLPIPVMTSHTRLEPGVFGILKPVLLLPDGIHNRLTPEQLHAILAHELCHVRRHDNLAAAMHMLVESIFWFHPMVWWIGKRMVEERERDCDEEVVRLGNDPGVYAEGILNVCKFYVRSPLRCASGVTGAGLKKRIESIVNSRIPQSLTFARKLLLAAAGLSVVAGPVLAGILQVPPDSTQAKAERSTFAVAPVKPPDPNAGGNPLAGVPGARGGGRGSLLRAQIVPTQATKAQEPASSSTQHVLLEDVPRSPESSLPKASGPTIEAIEFKGARIPQFALRAIITSQVGDACDIETLRRDRQILYGTGRFSDIRLETEPGPKGVVVRFVVVQRPLIQSIEYQGDGTVTVPEILERFKERKVQLRPETLYHEDELGLAAVTVQDLLAERGRQNITVIPLVEPIQPSTVKITFRVEKKE